MTERRIQTMVDMENEMRAVARGEQTPRKDAARPSVESAEVLLRLLTRENRELLRLIRDQRPDSVADLARLANRAPSNLLRTLSKLAAFGLIEMRVVGRRTVPFPLVHKLHVEIDPFSYNDRLEMA